MDSKIVLSEITVKLPETENQFYIQTDVKNDGREGFDLTLCDGVNVWQGSVSEETLDRLADERKMDFHDFVSQTKSAFTQEEIPGVAFEFSLECESSASAQFVWKKHILDDDIKFQLGNVNLQKLTDPGPGIRNILSLSITNINSLSSLIINLEATNKRLSSERSNALKRLEKCVQAKEELEQDLYSKFVAVLNTKKQKIQDLLDEKWLARTAAEDRCESPVASTSEIHHGKAHLKRPTSSDDDDALSDTDTKAPEVKKSHYSGKAKTDSLIDTSLNLECDAVDDKTTVKSVAPRPKRQPKKSKQTPNKPVLPRVSSGTTTGRLSRAGSKSTSRRSSLNKSSSEKLLDPDDLLNNL